MGVSSHEGSSRELRAQALIRAGELEHHVLEAEVRYEFSGRRFTSSGLRDSVGMRVVVLNEELSGIAASLSRQ